MAGITVLKYGRKSIVEVDYSDCKEQAMIKLLDALEQEMALKNEPQLILSIAMQELCGDWLCGGWKMTARNIHLIDKMAIVGISATQAVILKGYNFMFKRNFRAFDQRESAIAYLLDDSTSDRNPPDYR
jgi:hypothetical protein